MHIDRDTDFLEGKILLFNKPVYWTSFDLVKKVKNIIINKYGYGYKKFKVGHAGTLDPLASGLMILCTGKYTKRINELQNSNKEYYARFYLGKTTPSFDMETETDGNYRTEHITKELIETSLEGFLGEYNQIPPVFSAKNIKGKRAYDYARKGIEIEMEGRKVHFYELELLDFEPPMAEIRILCSKGTYIRSFARDLGESLDSGACLADLKRTAIGDYLLSDAFEIDEFELIVGQIN